jgi:hypothetical protein
MKFDLAEARAVLERTPTVLQVLLAGLPDAWTSGNQGPNTWSPFDVVGHLIDGEREDWIPRIRLILAHGEATPFTPFDRFSHLQANRDRTLGELLDSFAALRAENLAVLDSLQLTPVHLELRGTHPEFGPVTLRQLLATWVAHDLGHLVQISRTMARQYREEAGPWRAYLSALQA